VRRVENRFLRPLLRAAVGVTHALLAGNIRTVVGEQQIVIAAAAQERLDDISKQARVLRAEEPVTALLDGPAEFGIPLVSVVALVSRGGSGTPS